MKPPGQPDDSREVGSEALNGSYLPARICQPRYIILARVPTTAGGVTFCIVPNVRPGEPWKRRACPSHERSTTLSMRFMIT